MDRDAISAPIAGDEPSGPWLRREGTYALVQEAMRNDPGDPAYGIPEKRADWTEVVRLTREALQAKSKDFYLACCLLEGLTRTEGAAGLRDGLWVIAELHEKFWGDFHPRPRDEGENIDARINQLDALLQGFGRILDGLPMGSAADAPTRLDWRYAGQKLPGGDPSPWTEEQKNQTIQTTSWNDYDQTVTALGEALDELRRFDDLADTTYASAAPSLGELKEALTEAGDEFRRLLKQKGPDPNQSKAQQILKQAGCSFLTEEWLAEKVKASVPMPRLVNSIQAAVIDERAGVRPDEGWQALFDATWERGETYEQRSEAAPAVAPDPVAAAAPVVAAPAAAAGAPVAVAVPSGGSPLGAILGGCRALRAADPSSPVPYLVSRTVAWRALEGLSEGSATPGPPAGKREQCQSLFSSQQWPELLDLCESMLENQEAAGWLDLQRFACGAMGQRRAVYADARAELVRALRGLLARSPWLIEAENDDGAPAADDITRNWIKVEIGVTAGGAATAAEPGDNGSGDSDPALERATQLLESDGLDAAVRELQDAVQGASFARERALRLHHLGAICLQAERPELAAPILERLRADLTRRGLEDWEGPDFLGRTLEALCRSYTLIEASSASAEVAERKRAVADELAQVDLVRRLKMDDSLS